jgi:hypothetical protein
LWKIYRFYIFFFKNKMSSVGSVERNDEQNVEKGSEPSEPEPEGCILIPHRIWFNPERKSYLPWIFVHAMGTMTTIRKVKREKNETYVETTYSDEIEFAIDYYKCSYPKCKMWWKNDMKRNTSILTHLSKKEHYPWLEHLDSNFNKKEGDGKAKKYNKYECSVALLAAGFAPYQFTRDSPSGWYKHLQNFNYSVSSPATFSKHVSYFLDATLHKMKQHLKKKVVFFLGDSTPDKKKREWLSFGCTFICPETYKFTYMPLGLHQALGRLTKDAYSSHFFKVVNGWEMKTHIIESEGEEKGWDNLEDTIVIGGTSDCGAGLFNFFGMIFNTTASMCNYPIFFGPCMNHGVHIIVNNVIERQAEGLERGPVHYVEEIESIMKLLQNRIKFEAISAKYKLPFPGMHQRNRWTSLKDCLFYCFNNWSKFMQMKGTDDDIFTYENEGVDGVATRWNWKSFFEMIRVIYAVLEPMFGLSEKFQALGPLDGFFNVVEVLNVLTMYENEEFQMYSWDGNTMKKVKLVVGEMSADEQDVYNAMKETSIDYIKNSLCKRFFAYTLDYNRRIYHSGVKWDYLQNTTVLTLFCMSPWHSFNLLDVIITKQSWSMEMAQETKARLILNSKNALLYLFSKVTGTNLDKPIQESVLSQQVTMTSFMSNFLGVSEDVVEEKINDDRLRNRLWLHVHALQTSKKLSIAITKYMKQTIVADSLKKGTLAKARNELLLSWIDVIKDTSSLSLDVLDSTITESLVRILCITASQVFSNAETERNFSTVSRLLNPQRINTGNELLCAQLLACRAKEWAVKKIVDNSSSNLPRWVNKTNPASMKLGAPDHVEYDICADDAVEDETQTVLPTVTNQIVENEAQGQTSHNNRTTRPNSGARMKTLIQALYSDPDREDELENRETLEAIPCDEESDFEGC